MRKFLSLFLVFFLFTSFVFSKNFISSRIFEMRSDIPVSLSNNLISLNDIFVKDLVFDLPKIEEDVPDKGYESIFLLNPYISSKVNVYNFCFGSKWGIDCYLKFDLSKDFFKILGSGYKAGDVVRPEFNADMEIISYIDFPIEGEAGKFKFSVIPGIFLPLISLEDVSYEVSFTNDEDGKLKGDCKAKHNVLVSSGIYNVYKDTETDLFPFIQIYENKLLGFDLAGSFQFPVLSNLNLLITGHFPIIPGKLNQRVSYCEQYTTYDVPFMDFVTSGSNLDNYLETSGHGLEMEKLSNPFLVNRPLKLNVYCLYNPVKFINISAGAGVAFRHAFDSGDFLVYPEYYFDTTVNLFDVIKASVSTEYTDRIFKHSVNGVINLRLVELDLSLSMESADFLKSFNFYGIGAEVGLVIGF